MKKRICFAAALILALILPVADVPAESEDLKNVEVLMLRDKYAQAAKECRKILDGRKQGKIRAKAGRFLEICLLKQGSGEPLYFSVQVGCFSRKKNAGKLREELIERGFRAYILELPGDELYYVRVGKFSNKSEAKSLEKRLKSKGYPTKICP